MSSELFQNATQAPRSPTNATAPVVSHPEEQRPSETFSPDPVDTAIADAQREHRLGGRPPVPRPSLFCRQTHGRAGLSPEPAATASGPNLLPATSSASGLLSGERPSKVRGVSVAFLWRTEYGFLAFAYDVIDSRRRRLGALGAAILGHLTCRLAVQTL